MKSLFFAIIFASLAATSSSATVLEAITCLDNGQEVVAITKKGSSYTYSKLQIDVSTGVPKKIYKEVSDLTLSECYQDGEGAYLVSCWGKLKQSVIKLRTTVKINNSLVVERNANNIATGVVKRKEEPNEIQFEIKKLTGTSGGEKDWEKSEEHTTEVKFKNGECRIN